MTCIFSLLPIHKSSHENVQRYSLLPFWFHILLDKLTSCVTYDLTSLIYKRTVREGGIIIITKFSSDKETMEPPDTITGTIPHSSGKAIMREMD